MKKIIYAIAAMAVLFSCQKNEFTEETLRADVFNASIENAFQTKTALQSDYNVWWKDGDKIDINGVEYTATAKADSTKATFAVSGSEATKIEGNYHAFYPASIASGTGATGTLPGTVSYDAGATYLPMYAEGTGNSLAFKNICAAVKVCVSSSVTVKSIKVTADKAVNGAFAVSDNVAVMSKTSGLTDEEKSVILDCGAGVAGTSFYIPVPATTYGSLKVTLTKGDDSTETMTATAASIPMSVNTIYSFNFRKDGSFKLSETTITELL